MEVKIDDFKSLVKVLGISKRRFGDIIGVKGSTITKYINNPTELRLKHISLFCEEQDVSRYGVTEKDVIKIIRDNER